MDLLRLARQAGWDKVRIDPMPGGHARLSFEDDTRTGHIVVSASPSDYRSRLNIKATLRALHKGRTRTRMGNNALRNKQEEQTS